MNSIQATALFTGFLLVLGAVGGMDAVPVWEPNPWFFHQLGAAFIGMFLMFMAVFTQPLTMEVRDE
jgi:hypothetical protein